MTAPDETPRMIANTDQPMRHPWPADCYVQGGGHGIVFKRGGGSYRTAFVEAFPDTFLRGEGPTLADAEDACWIKYQTMQACPAAPDHGPFEARGYTNGAGFCTRCGGWFARVLPPQPEQGDVRPNSLLHRAFTGDVDAAVEAIGTYLDAQGRG